MKITKKNQKVDAADKYAESTQHIMAAINVLGATAKTDPKARDAIANLSVVLLDLK